MNLTEEVLTDSKTYFCKHLCSNKYEYFGLCTQDIYGDCIGKKEKEIKLCKYCQINNFIKHVEDNLYWKNRV